MTLKIARTEVGQEEDIGDDIDALESTEVPKLNAHAPKPKDQAWYSLFFLSQTIFYFFFSKQFEYFQTIFCQTFCMSPPLLMEVNNGEKDYGLKDIDYN